MVLIYVICNWDYKLAIGYYDWLVLALVSKIVLFVIASSKMCEFLIFLVKTLYTLSPQWINKIPHPYVPHNNQTEFDLARQNLLELVRSETRVVLMPRYNLCKNFNSTNVLPFWSHCNITRVRLLKKMGWRIKNIFLWYNASKDQELRT